MKTSMSLKILSCLILYATGTHAIMVKFGTKNGPIEPPTPEPLPKPQPYRVPAPVWEARSDDLPDPNAQWRPQLFFPQPRYTQVVFNSVPSQPAQTSAQRFVSAYRVTQSTNAPVPTEYINPTFILGSQSLPGIGIRYFIPTFVNELQARKEEKRHEDVKYNEIETNNIDDPKKDSSTDQLWKNEKDSARRISRQTLEGAPGPVFQWPAYVQSRH